MLVYCYQYLESIFINCKSFNSLQEFVSTILECISTPTQDCPCEAQRHQAAKVTSVKEQHLDSFLIILGNFNSTHFSLLHTQDQCYTVLKDCSVPHAALGCSVHFLTHFIPSYGQKIKYAKPVISASKKRARARTGYRPVLTAPTALLNLQKKKVWTSLLTSDFMRGYYDKR